MRIRFPSDDRDGADAGPSATILWQQGSLATRWTVSIWAKFEDGGLALLGRVQPALPSTAHVYAIAYVCAPGALGIYLSAETFPKGSPDKAEAAVNCEPYRNAVGGPTGIFPSVYSVLVP